MKSDTMSENSAASHTVPRSPATSPKPREGPRTRAFRTASLRRFVGAEDEDAVDDVDAEGRRRRSDHHGLAPPIESRAPSAPRPAPTIATRRPKVLPDSSEKPPPSWMSPRMIVTQPRALRLVKTEALAAREDVRVVQGTDAVDDVDGCPRSAAALPRMRPDRYLACSSPLRWIPEPRRSAASVAHHPDQTTRGARREGRAPLFVPGVRPRRPPPARARASAASRGAWAGTSCARRAASWWPGAGRRG